MPRRNDFSRTQAQTCLGVGNRGRIWCNKAGDPDSIAGFVVALARETQGGQKYAYSSAEIHST